ncbi:ribosomal RNA processing protein 36 homolog [Portunus trituberculatus]|uniref:rRNA biogenesis protein RRP36 n=1 Tax=Portunus trituberculatus TaxID=210409 RepID=A0A5B7D4F9_PORTR|nr:ribosomal RNA processing protein 36 homolog [Portunus trituberculatus]MPC14753.1 Ribosomal RNA processing protein 36 [Portunus trituberculatus]
MGPKYQGLKRRHPDSTTAAVHQDDSGSESDESDSEGEFQQDDQDSGQDQKGVNFQEMTMEELLKLQEDIGTKAFQKKVLKTGSGILSSTSPAVEQKRKSIKVKRANKNGPAEVPMVRHAVPRLATLQPGQNMKRKITRDPRFDDLSGNLNLRAWQENYGFLKEMRKKEKDILKKEWKEEVDPEKRKRMKSIVQRMENQEREQARKEREKEVKRQQQQEQRDALRQGRKPKFLPNKERKLLVKAAHFEDLKKGNKVEKYLERKEKRLNAKEMKKRKKF